MSTRWFWEWTLVASFWCRDKFGVRYRENREGAQEPRIAEYKEAKYSDSDEELEYA